MEDTDAEPPPPTDTSFERLPALLEGISGAGEVLLYEGLPSEFWEPELRRRELAQKATTNQHGYPLYDETQPIEEPDVRRLTEVLSAAASYARYRGAKACGEFQPEYALEWKTDATSTLALISLECGEVKLFGPESELYCDLSAEVVSELTRILSPYQKNNPTPETP